MSAFAELFKKADNFTVTDIHVTRKTHHHGIVNQEGTGYQEFVLSREVSINLTDNRGMIVNLNAEFYESCDNLDFGLVNRYNYDFSNGNGDVRLRLSAQSDEPMWLILTESDLADDDVTQYLMGAETLKPDYAIVFASNLLDDLVKNESEYTQIKNAFWASFR